MYSKSTKVKSKSNSTHKKGGRSSGCKASNSKGKAYNTTYKKKGTSNTKNTKTNSNTRRKKQSLLKKMSKKLKNKLKQIILRKWEDVKTINFKYDSANSKVFSTTCNLMTLSIVLLCVLFVYIEDSLFYTFPLITVIYVFIKKGKGNRYKDYSDRDLLLYKRIILINLFIVLAIYFHYQEDLWFINFFMVSIFLVPLIIAKCSKA